MTKYTLICDHSCDLDTHVVTHTFTADYLPHVLENMEQFLRGAGFYFDGNLDIINEQTDDCGHSEHYFDSERNK